MARTRNQKNGRLEEAMTTLLQNQAVLVQTQTAFVHQMRERDIEMLEFRRRFDQIDQRLASIEAILRDHNRKIENLTDAVREKIGFK